MDKVGIVWTVEELASHWKVKASTVYGLIRSGRLSAFKVGVGYRVSNEAVRRFEEGESA